MPGLTQFEMQLLIDAVDRNPACRTLGIAFEGRGMTQIVREPPIPVGLRTWILLREEEVSESDAASPTAAAQPAPSNLGGELLNMGLSCGSAVLAGVAVAGGAGAAPVTGGASLAITVLAWAGAVATAAQCGIATGRVINEIFDPGANEQYLDSQEWYQNASATLDAISVAGGLAGLGQAAQAALRLSRTSGRPLSQIIRAMNRAERKRLAQDLARYTGQTQTRRQFIRLARDGRIPRIFTRQQVNQAVINEMLNSISAGLTLAGSAASGVVRQVTVYFIEDE